MEGLKMGVALKILKVLSRVRRIDGFLKKFSRGYLDISTGFSYDINVNGEKQILQHLSKIFPNEFCFLDVGANIGSWSSVVLKFFPNYEGHLFEVTPQTFQNLETNLGNKETLKLNDIALSDTAGTMELLDYGTNFGGNTLLKEADYHKKPYNLISVKTMTGSVYCKENNLDRVHFLKIDTEGTELAVLKGFEPMLASKSIDIIQFEYGYTHGDAYTLMRDFYKFFEDYGYILGALRETGVNFKKFSYSDNDFKSGPNYIACLPEYLEKLSNFREPK